MSQERKFWAEKRKSPIIQLLPSLVLSGFAVFSGACNQEGNSGQEIPIPVPKPVESMAAPIIQEQNQLFIIEPKPTPSPTEGTEKLVTIYWVFAHPDDETLAAAGAIAQSQESGYRNVVIIVSTGENTVVGKRLGLTKTQTAVAREKEARAASAILGIQDENIRFLGIPDGQVTIELVRDFIERLLTETKGEVLIRGHSPDDFYLGLTGGHPDHRAVGMALLILWQEGKININNIRLYRIGQLFGGPKAGLCENLSKSQSSAKQKMRGEYFHFNSSQGRFGIAGQSVPGAWVKAKTEPECYDTPQ